MIVGSLTSGGSEASQPAGRKVMAAFLWRRNPWSFGNQGFRNDRKVFLCPNGREGGLPGTGIGTEHDAIVSEVTGKKHVVDVKGGQTNLMSRTTGWMLIASLLLVMGGQRTVWSQQGEINELKRSIADLQKRLEALEEKQKKDQAAAEKAPKPVVSGFGKIKIGGLAQNWLVTDDAAGANESYRLRRMELNFKGEINDRVSWGVMVDPSKALAMNAAGATQAVNQRSNVLQDAMIALKLTDNVTVDVGQEKLPLSLEGLQSSAKLETVERALFITGPRTGSAGAATSAGYGDVRSAGVQLKTKFKDGDFTAAITNDSGESQNTTDNNSGKSISGRVTYRPAQVPGLQLGVSALGGSGVTPNPTLTPVVIGGMDRDRFGGEVLYQKKGWTVKSEYMTGSDQVAGGAAPLAFNRKGFYFHVGKQLNPEWEVVGRYDAWDPDEVENGIAKGIGVTPDEKDLILGVNYYLESFHAKLQLNWVHKNFEKSLAAPAVQFPDRDQILVNVQTAW